MASFEGETFSGQRIVLDGNAYRNCRFEQCEIIITATASKTVVDCNFVNCRWDFDGPARTTIQDLIKLYQMPGMAPVIENLFNIIRKGPQAPEGETRQ
jgi:hypothetical protein